jgi:hypothetical protein
MFSDLDSLWLRMWVRGQAPAAAKRCAEGAGLEGAPTSVKSYWRSQILPTQSLLRLFGLWFCSDPRRALCVRAAFAAPTYIRPGTTRSKVPHAHCEGAGLQGGWDHSLPRRLSALSRPGHTSTLDLISSFSPSVFDLRSSSLEDGTSWHQASFKITP